MLPGLQLLSQLGTEDIDWMVANGQELSVGPDRVLIEEGTLPSGLFFILAGLAEARVAALPQATSVPLGPGAIVGEMSFIEHRPASATVRTTEHSLVLAVPLPRLRQHLDQDPAFAARLYRAFAITASQRLREREARMGQWTQAASGPAPALWARLSHRLEHFKRLLQGIDQKLIKTKGEISEEDENGIKAGFATFVQSLNDMIGDGAAVAESVREEFGARVQRDLLPWLMLTRTAERFYSKPRGYAGDYLSIAWMYENQAQGTGRLGPVIDRCFLDEPPCCAVRNRRRLLAEQIQRHLNGNDGRPIRVTTMACGPAREVFDVFATLADPSRLEATLIDVDQEALAYVRQEIAARGLERQISVFQGNLVYLAMGRQKIDLPGQDLIYSMGLIDYLNDKLVGKLMDWVHANLAPGGEMILGNFHTSSRTKALADYVLDWRMIHRTVDDMNRLCAGSAFQRPCTEILFEAAQVDLFAKCRKE